MNRNTYLNLSDDEILQHIDQAIENYECDGHHQHCEPIKCPNCNETLWHEHDIWDYIASELRNVK